MSPTARTLKALRAAGYIAAVVEHWNPHAGIRQDLFGWCDVVAIRADKPGVLGVQATTASNQASRLKKTEANPTLDTWLASGNRAQVWGWVKRKGKWFVTRQELSRTPNHGKS